MKDILFELYTGETGKSEFITPTIKGEIVAIMILAESPITVNISFEDDKRIILYNDIQFIGAKYLPLGIEPVFRDGDKIRYSLVNWCLNNKLRVNITGGKFTTAKFTIRYIEK